MSRETRNLNLSVLLFFVFLVIGLFTGNDYGVTVDEVTERNSDIVTYRWMNRFILDRGVFVNEGTEDLAGYKDRYYGVAVRLPLIFIEDVYQIVTHETMSTRSVYLIRHYYNHFIYILSLYCFYRLLLNLFGSKTVGIIGVLMVYSFGRFFSHSFYNIKDLMFSSLFTIDLFFAEKVISSKYKRKWCFWFAVISALTVSARIIGALLPLSLLVFIAGKHIIQQEKLPWAAIGIICLAYPIWLLITPASWLDPFRYSINCVLTFSDFNNNPGQNLFGGEWVPNDAAPADYFLRWMVLTIPLVYQLYIISGIMIFAVILAKKNKKIITTENKPILLITGCIMVFTILYQMIRRPSVYNDWRHVFFLYPIMIIFASLTIKVILNTGSKIIRMISIGILSISFIYNSLQIIQNHPYEYEAYNPIGQKYAHEYEGDYWGMSIYQHFLWIANHNNEVKSVTCYFPSRTGIRSHYLMLNDEQQYLVRIPSVDTDYLIVWLSAPMDFYWKDENTGKAPVIEGYEEVNPIFSYGVKISSLYQKVRN